MNIWWSKDPFSFPWLPASVTFSLIKHNFNIIYNKRGINQYKEPIYILKAVNSEKSLHHKKKKRNRHLKSEFALFQTSLLLCYVNVYECMLNIGKYRHFSSKL